MALGEKINSKRSSTMKKNISLFSVLFTFTLILIGSHIATAQTSDLSSQGSKFITMLSSGDYKSAVELFDETMKKALPEQKLKETWQAIQAQAGSFKAQGTVRKEKIQNIDVIFVNCQFEKSTLDSQIAFDNQGKIAGLYFIPSISK
jgi:uncharacterized protein